MYSKSSLARLDPFSLDSHTNVYLFFTQFDGPSFAFSWITIFFVYFTRLFVVTHIYVLSA